jgi:hypothetical protein
LVLEFRDGSEKEVCEREGSERKVSERRISLKERFLKDTCFGALRIRRIKGGRYIRSGYAVSCEQ